MPLPIESSHWLLALILGSDLGFLLFPPLHLSVFFFLFFALCELSSAFPGKWEMSCGAIEVNQFDNVQ